MPLSAVERRLLPLCLLLLFATGCQSYKQNIMFKPAEGYAGAPLPALSAEADKNYVIQPGDRLKLEVYSNRGERLIDPNGELSIPPAATNANAGRPVPEYLVMVDGTVLFPMIEPIKVTGMTIREAQLKLQVEYNKFYKECYVVLAFVNKRVVVLGSPGGQVIPLANENMKVTEVLALAKGIGNDGKAHRIRLIRGEEVFLLDLSTIDGLTKSNMIVEPGDIVYVEPIRRPFAESSRDLAPVFSLVVSLSTLVVVFLSTR